MPTALVCGLVILLLGGTLLLRSQNDQVTASMQQAADSSLNTTEGGVARLQAFIEANRAIATYDLRDWLTATTTLSSVLSSCSPTTTTQIVNFATTATTWQNIDPQNPGRGQFRLVNYTYIPDNPAQPRSAPGRGVLEVEGRSQSQQSTNRLRITIPILVGDMTGAPVPGLWLAEGGTSNNTIQGNVLLNDCRVSLNSVNVTGNDPATGQPYRAQYTNLRLPALPPIPSPLFNSLPTNINTNVTLPRPQDTPTMRVIRGQTYPIYEYDVNDLNIANNRSLTITPGAMVRFYLRGNIRRGGNINHSCAGSSTCDPTNFQIYGYGGQNSSICLNGNNRIDAFILAPNYAVGVAGTGGGQGGFFGAVWTRDWSNSGACGSNTSNITVTQLANWDFAPGLPQNLPPKLAPASTWERLDIAQQSQLDSQ
ncbi:hypothetical protein H6G89_01685 [Oscillatoria sp. FACHB-1407]|uniref:DUF7305 domain-containing protein n=1 Tax=Oscillatoria sp. FACHB-1407 TaxID=2692847 RepID=UPI0016828D72|nr:hypothetical protein [Oscillatoria sp. FACHB-1407]MBD2459743.1 hypothetical protein [Oscillatoria sp. FACHB-1407]